MEKLDPNACQEAHDAARLQLDFRPPLDWTRMLAFFEKRAIVGVEEISGGTYRRTLRAGESRGWIEASLAAGNQAIQVDVSRSLAPHSVAVTAGLRRQFDLDADPAEIAKHLSQDPFLALRCERAPGLRMPGVADRFEGCVRAVLGQQISVIAATTLARRLTQQFGERIETPFGSLDRLFPTADKLAGCDADALADLLGMPKSRASTVVALAEAVSAGEVVLESADVDEVVEKLLAIRGIGPWTAEYIAMRVLHTPDAFPATDLGVKKALDLKKRDDLERRAEAWRPWRAYAVMHLWTNPPEGDEQ